MDLDEVADELYALPPGEFISARDARAAEARQTGDRDLAAAVKKLRRPTAGAWLANLVAHEGRAGLDALLDLGARMREAQEGLAGSDLRRLARDRRQAVASLTKEGRRLAAARGQPPSDASVEELRATLEAAVADAEAAAALRSGRLTAALHYSGFGPLGLPADAGLPPPSGPAEPVPGREQAASARETRRGAGEPSPSRVESRAGERSQAGGHRQPDEPSEADERRKARELRDADERARADERRRAAVQAVRDAEARLADAETEAAGQEDRLCQARDERDRCRQEIGELEERLRDLRAAAEQAEDGVDDARRAHRAAQDAADAARDELTRARAVLDRFPLARG